MFLFQGHEKYFRKESTTSLCLHFYHRWCHYHGLSSPAILLLFLVHFLPKFREVALMCVDATSTDTVKYQRRWNKAREKRVSGGTWISIFAYCFVLLRRKYFVRNKVCGILMSAHSKKCIAGRHEKRSVAAKSGRCGVQLLRRAASRLRCVFLNTKALRACFWSVASYLTMWNLHAAESRFIVGLVESNDSALLQITATAVGRDRRGGDCLCHVHHRKGDSNKISTAVGSLENEPTQDVRTHIDTHTGHTPP